MNRQNNFVFELYKPFRNQIRQYNLLDSLYVIWGYSRNFSFDYDFPRDIERQKGFDPYGQLNARRHRGIFEFEQAFLMKEFILHCDQMPSVKTLKLNHSLAKLINYLRFEFQEKIDLKFSSPDDVFIEFNRIFHKQLKWQYGFKNTVILRYYKIFSDPELSRMIHNKLGLTTYEIYLMGFYVFGATAKDFLTVYPIVSNIEIIDSSKFKLFFEIFAYNFDNAREDIKDTQIIDENFFYSFNPLFAKPILIYKNSYLCPVHLLLFWQFTDGIYYHLINEAGFDRIFGKAYENYIGEVIKKCCSNSSLAIFPEVSFGKEEKRTSDWIIQDENAILFIECKTKRMTLESKINLDVTKGLNVDLKKMAGFITQIYKTYEDYRNNRYPHLKYESNKAFIPLVVTLEPWHLQINHVISATLKNMVIDSLKENNINTSLLELFPYYVLSTNDFEEGMQIIDSIGIVNYFNIFKTNDAEKVRENFEFKNIFKEEFKSIFIDSLKK